MSRVEVWPLPLVFRAIPQRLWPQTPPTFPDGSPTREDVALARELVAALDPWSRKWYAANFERFPDPA